MKKHLLIFLSTLVFVVLFYNQDLGLNLSIFAIFLMLFNFIQKPDLVKDKRALLLASAVLLCSISNAWLISFTTFLAVMVTSFVFRLYCENQKLRLITQAIVFVSNLFAAVVQFFQFNTWLETKKSDKEKLFVKIFSYVLLPFLILGIFFALYVSTSDTLLAWFKRFELDINFYIIFVMMFGFYISFVFWNAKIYEVFETLNHSLKLNFSKESKESQKTTFDFLPIEFEMRSGIITLVCLNMMLLIFIVVFNIEHIQNPAINLRDFSSRIHEQIYSIIGSIVLAMLVILFYFKDTLNFIQNNKYLVFGAKCWVILNAVLVVSAVYQNTIYITNLGLTYKRLGVYMFLILCFYGLHFTFKKIKNKKTNFYLIDKMTWGFFYTLVFCSLINWANFITYYNLSFDETNVEYLEYNFEGNEKRLFDYYKTNDLEIPQYLLDRVNRQKEKSFLSSQLYYKTIDLN
ncbi:DUF4173 domain-containing protein [Paenimyroides tangerinum]|uniref:DUF4173 domain-containing protein n=1 Tax=Paenimyroides tangerinum TaxID=2488728 RepID=A0A3P3WDW4_9FLAO|nr:DUF4153 domain-containing protein [Paenimyroides tangerinum]RRJ92824.1 DUF4173 domain-containing protein [Paenimyroides tangerinum]